MEIEALETVKVDAKTLKINMKVSDRFCAKLESRAGSIIHEQQNDYVPDFMPEKHFGDYIMLDIDIDTGQITNWTPPTAEQIQDWINPEYDE